MRGNFVQGAARTCNGAPQMVHEHPWGPKPHAPSITSLPASVGKLFGMHRVALSHQLMDFASVQALAVCS